MLWNTKTKHGETEVGSDSVSADEEVAKTGQSDEQSPYGDAEKIVTATYTPEEYKKVVRKADL